jgi:hypothetical protein
MKFDLSIIKISKPDIRRNIRFPEELTPELAEFIGIMIGDGHLTRVIGKNRDGSNSLKSDIVISGNKKELNYHKMIISLFENLFSLKLHYYQDSKPGAIVLKAYSKGIVNFLHKICEIPLNRKCHLVSIPKLIKNSDNKTKHAFLRGLSDTDFTITFKNKTKKGHTYPVIKASFKSKQLIKDLEILFKKLGFRYCTLYDERTYDTRFGETTKHNIYLNGKDNFLRWIELINSSNNKFQRKIEKWQRDGICPPGY